MDDLLRTIKQFIQLDNKSYLVNRPFVNLL